MHVYKYHIICNISMYFHIRKYEYIINIKTRKRWDRDHVAHKIGVLRS